MTRRAAHASDCYEHDADALSVASIYALTRQLNAAIEHGDDERAELALSLLAEVES